MTLDINANANAARIRRDGLALTKTRLLEVERKFHDIGGAYILIAAVIRDQHSHILTGGNHPMDDPKICPPDHKHGQNYTCYSHGCRCADCRGHHAEVRAHDYKLKAVGRFQPRTVPALGARRRIQALMACGWSMQLLSNQLGRNHANLWLTMTKPGPWIYRSTADAVAELFDELWDKKPPTATGPQRASVSRAKNTAAARGWPPPLAWDDIDNDPEPPTVIPDDARDMEAAHHYVDDIAVELACAGQNIRLNYAERREAIRILNRRKLMDSEISEILGLTTKSVWRIREQLGLPAAVGADRMPIAS